MVVYNRNSKKQNCYDPNIPQEPVSRFLNGGCRWVSCTLMLGCCCCFGRNLDDRIETCLSTHDSKRCLNRCIHTAPVNTHVTHWIIIQSVKLYYVLSYKQVFVSLQSCIKWAQTKKCENKTEALDHECFPAKRRYSTQSFCPVLDSWRGTDLTLQWVWSCTDELLYLPLQSRLRDCTHTQIHKHRHIHNYA